MRLCDMVLVFCCARNSDFHPIYGHRPRKEKSIRSSRSILYQNFHIVSRINSITTWLSIFRASHLWPLCHNVLSTAQSRHGCRLHLYPRALQTHPELALYLPEVFLPAPRRYSQNYPRNPAPISKVSCQVSVFSCPAPHMELIGISDSSQPTIPKYAFPQEERLEIPREAGTATQHPEAYTSFGDNGTTASVNVHGNLIQISRFLGQGPSGFLSVDLPNTPDPSLVQERAQELADASTNPGSTISGLYMEDSSGIVQALNGVKPHLDFVRDRWPRFSFDADAFTLAVQYFIHNDTVFQQHVFERKPGREYVQVIPDVMMDTDVLIRHLDHTAGQDKFNEARNYSSEDYSASLGPHGYSLILNHYGLPRNDASTATLPGSEQLGDQNQSDAASLVLALFINGAAQKIEEVQNKWYKIQNQNQAEAEFIKSGRVEITMAFRLHISSKDSTWQSSLIPARDLSAMDEEFYTTPFRHLSLSPCPHENFALRRNLEHVLSVCSIPISQNGGPVPASDSCPPVALTCGDFAGHRLTTATSL